MAGTGYTLGDFTADRAEEHVVIQARVGAQGRLTHEDGSPLPHLREGSAVQLRVRASSLVDKAQRKTLSALVVRELLPAGTTLWAMVDARAVHDAASGAQLKRTGLTDFLLRARQAANQMRNTQGGVEVLRSKDAPQPHEGVLQVRLNRPGFRGGCLV